MAKPDFVNGPTGRLAYRKTEGASPTIVFMGGFMSDMEGTKAKFLEEWARDRGRAYLRFDYSGHGASDGAFRDGTIGSWLDDALHIIDAVASGPAVIVGSSMGGWIGLLAARARPDRIRGFVGIAAAPDFTDWLWSRDLTPAQQRDITEKGYVELASAHDDQPYIFTRALFDDGTAHRLLDTEIAIDCPVRLIQGAQDAEVPAETAFRLAEALRATDVEIVWVKSGDHRLSSPRDLDRLTSVLDRLLADLGGKRG